MQFVECTWHSDRVSNFAAVLAATYLASRPSPTLGPLRAAGAGTNSNVGTNSQLAQCRLLLVLTFLLSLGSDAEQSCNLALHTG